MLVRLVSAAIAALIPLTSAVASEQDAELWLNPSVAVALDGNTEMELETAQRLRSAAEGRDDTFYVRLWLNQAISTRFTLSGGVERRTNRPGSDETRFMQQLSGRHGVLRGRLRLEQRLVDGQRLGLRLRSRLGVEVPLDEAGRLAFLANAESFLTMRSTSEGGDDGLTGLRTQIGASYAVSDSVEVTLAYLRQQDFRDDGPDRIGHAPLIGLELSF